jgi:hypothetical protein
VRSGLAALGVLFALGCGPVPGGELSGVVTPAPASWADALGGDRALCEVGHQGLIHDEDAGVV